MVGLAAYRIKATHLTFYSALTTAIKWELSKNLTIGNRDISSTQFLSFTRRSSPSEPLQYFNEQTNQHRLQQLKKSGMYQVPNISSLSFT
jgi:hypothetical protein